MKRKSENNEEVTSSKRQKTSNEFELPLEFEIETENKLATNNIFSFTQEPQAPKKVLHSKIENGVLLKFDKRDAESGHFECSEITEVGEDSFRDCEILTSVNLPKVKKIGGKAFCNCHRLGTLNLPEVKSIGSFAFYQCKALTSVNLAKVEQIGEGAFYGCSALSDLNLPEVKTIGASAFRKCKALTSVDLRQLEQISVSVFAECEKLSIVSLPKVKNIAISAFFKCDALTIITLHQQTQAQILSFPETLNLKYLNIEGVTKGTCMKKVYRDLPESLQNQNIILNKDEQIKRFFYNKSALDTTNLYNDVKNTIMNFSTKLSFFKRKESNNNDELPTDTPVMLAN